MYVYVPKPVNHMLISVHYNELCDLSRKLGSTSWTNELRSVQRQTEHRQKKYSKVKKRQNISNGRDTSLCRGSNHGSVSGK